MNIRFTSISILFTTLVFSPLVHAEIYKNVDAEGRVTYSNVKIKGGKKLYLEPADTNFGNSSGGETKRGTSGKTTTPASFPKVDANTQNQRDGKRKEILQSELDNEKKALDEAKKAYAEGESNPEIYHKSRQVITKNADGSTKAQTITDTFRNVPKFDEKMKTLQADIDAHQRNIELLEKEIRTIN